MPNKLPFGDLLSESFGFFFTNLRLFFHLVTIPWIISLVLRIAAAGLNRESPLGMLAEKAIDVIPTVMFMVAWMRVVLMGPRSVERLPGLGWSARESAFLMHLIRIGGVTFLLIGAFVLTLGSIDPAGLSSGQIDPDLAKRETGGIRFLQSVTEAELERFVQVFLAAEDPALAPHLAETVAEAAIEHIVPVPAAQLDPDDLARELDAQPQVTTPRARAAGVLAGDGRHASHRAAGPSERPTRPAAREARRAAHRRQRAAQRDHARRSDRTQGP